MLLKYLNDHYLVKNSSAQYFIVDTSRIHIHVLISGIGMVSTAYYLGKLYAHDFSIAINVGICGAFDRNIQIGELVIVQEDVFSELGAENGKSFLKASEAGLGDECIVPKKLFIPKVFSSIKKVKGITVNKVHGQVNSIRKVNQLYQPQIESMEGAAFYYACNKNHWKCLQIRSVSNYVEKRNKDKWNIPLAIKNLNHSLIQYIQSL